MNQPELMEIMIYLPFKSLRWLQYLPFHLGYDIVLDVNFRDSDLVFLITTVPSLLVNVMFLPNVKYTCSDYKLN